MHRDRWFLRDKEILKRKYIVRNCEWDDDERNETNGEVSKRKRGKLFLRFILPFLSFSFCFFVSISFLFFFLFCVSYVRIITIITYHVDEFLYDPARLCTPIWSHEIHTHTHIYIHTTYTYYLYSIYSIHDIKWFFFIFEREEKIKCIYLTHHLRMVIIRRTREPSPALCQSVDETRNEIAFNSL